MKTKIIMSGNRGNQDALDGICSIGEAEDFVDAKISAFAHLLQYKRLRLERIN